MAAGANRSVLSISRHSRVTTTLESTVASTPVEFGESSPDMISADVS